MLGAILGAAGALGKVFGGGAKSAEDSRMKQFEALLQQDQLRNQQYGIGQNAQMQLADRDLARKQFSEQARGNRAKQAMLGDILANWRPTEVSVPGIKNAQISGGLQTLGQGARDSAKLLNLQALLAQLQGDKFEGGGILQAPQLSQMPKAGKMEKIGGILGTIGSIAGALGPFLGKESSFQMPSGLSAISGLTQMPGQQVSMGEFPGLQSATGNPDLWKNVRF